MIEVIMNLGELLKFARKRKGFTMEQLGNQTGISHGFISLYERNKRIPSDRILRIMALNLDMDFEDLRDAAESARFARDMSKIYKRYNFKVEQVE